MGPKNHPNKETNDNVKCFICDKSISQEQIIKINQDSYCKDCAVEALLNNQEDNSQNNDIKNDNVQIENNEKVAVNNENNKSDIEKKYERYLDDLYYDEKNDGIKIKENKNYEPNLKKQLLSYELDHGSIASIPIQKSYLRNPDKSLTFERDDKKYNTGRNNNKSDERTYNKINSFNDTVNNNLTDKYYIKTEANPYPNLSVVNKKSLPDDDVEREINKQSLNRQKREKIKSINNDNKQSFNKNRKSSVNNKQPSSENEKTILETNKKSGNINLHKKSVFDHDNSKSNKDNDSKFITFIFIILIIFMLFIIAHGISLITGQSILDYFNQLKL
ncbi:MAG: hypothetical protein LBT10_08260 [Methanobrevibacter sp.]|jgi:hypothetical protein|nr:hypothetical protein [Methanobrevibacter sp.]